MSIAQSDNSPLLSAHCSSWRVLAWNGRHEIPVKAKHEIVFEVEDVSATEVKECLSCAFFQTLSHEPGDAYYVLFDNLSSEVEYILERCSDVEGGAYDKPCTIESTDEEKKAPEFIAPITTPRQILTQCYEIRRSPGRVKV